MSAVSIIIPCYNEARRLNVAALQSYLALPESPGFLFVDDGSTDNTAVVLENICRQNSNRAAILRCVRNGGKAEAVRAGLNEVLRKGAELAGFWDADLATPLDAIGRFVNVLREQPQIAMVFGARVKLLGRHVHRRALRHYAGRIFATAASTALDLPIYDTQCGAKIFRVDDRLRTVVAQPFLSKWVFDVEMLARYRRLCDNNSRRLEALIYEYPLEQWEDVASSKVHPVDFLHSFVDLVRIRARYW